MSSSLTCKLPGHYRAPKTSFPLGHTKSYFTVTLCTEQQCILYLAFKRRRRNCIALLLSAAEQDSTSRPQVKQSLKVTFTASSHPPRMEKATSIRFSNRSLKNFSFPQYILQTPLAYYLKSKQHPTSEPDPQVAL